MALELILTRNQIEPELPLLPEATAGGSWLRFKYSADLSIITDLDEDQILPVLDLTAEGGEQVYVHAICPISCDIEKLCTILAKNKTILLKVFEEYGLQQGIIDYKLDSYLFEENADQHDFLPLLKGKFSVYGRVFFADAYLEEVCKNKAFIDQRRQPAPYCPMNEPAIAAVDYLKNNGHIIINCN